ncbi:hypothetical protein JZO82_01485 [Vagococcus fluvialis]|uniref:hypothetical protein n=1 Tax=Vagococcus fluvialis TaxID=2738 RepID=UPI001A8F0602|nr:hypothetical protein [Vagococcus fluvialis]MBO0427822.1 hypothetical protein [Vagococcus fluvialis]
MKEWFFDNNGIFQWASIAAIVAAITAIFSFGFSLAGYFNSKKALENQKIMDQKKIDADIIAKSRIAWNQDTRKIASEIINAAYMCYRTLKSYAYQCHTYWSVEEGKAYSPIHDKEELLTEIQKNNELLSEEFDKNYEDFKKVSNQFKLYFGDNPGNNELLGKVSEIQSQIDKIDNLRHSYQKNMGPKEALDLNKDIDKSRVEYDNSISVFALSLRIYLKEEWNKAKKGE